MVNLNGIFIVMYQASRYLTMICTPPMYSCGSQDTEFSQCCRICPTRLSSGWESTNSRKNLVTCGANLALAARIHVRCPEASSIHKTLLILPMCMLLDILILKCVYTGMHKMYQGMMVLNQATYLVWHKTLVLDHVHVDLRV